MTQLKQPQSQHYFDKKLFTSCEKYSLNSYCNAMQCNTSSNCQRMMLVLSSNVSKQTIISTSK